MIASLKIRALEDKILELQTKQTDLIKKRNLDIARDLSKLNLAHIDHMKLMGALLFIQDKISTNDSIAEDWFIAGGKFLRRQKGKSGGTSSKAPQTIPANQQS